MARDFTAASSQYFEKTTSPITVPPFSMVGWYNLASLDPGQDGTVLCIGDRSATNLHFLQYRDAGNTMRVGTKVSGNTQTAAASATMTAGVWHHVAGVWATTSSRRVYLDAGNSAENTDLVEPSGIDGMIVGAVIDSTTREDFCNDKLGLIGLYDVALTLNEVTALRRGSRPFDVRPGSLKALYWCNAAGDLVDLSGNLNNLTETNGPISLVSDPPVVPYSARFWGHGPLVEEAVAGVEIPTLVTAPYIAA